MLREILLEGIGLVPVGCFCVSLMQSCRGGVSPAEAFFAISKGHRVAWSYPWKIKALHL